MRTPVQKKVAGYMEYIGKGYAYSSGVFDYNTAAENNTKKAYSGKISDKAYKELEAMLPTLSGKWSRSYGCEYAKSTV